MKGEGRTEVYPRVVDIQNCQIDVCAEIIPNDFNIESTGELAQDV
jgi:hypothetical protein